LTNIQAKVDRLTKIAERVIEVALITENKELLPRYISGAHIDLFSPPALHVLVRSQNPALTRTMRQYVVAVGLAPTSRGGSEV
jgi:hypothetical protein